MYYDILKKYNLTEIKIIRKPDGGGVRSYVVLAKSISSTKEYILKMFSSSDANAKERFISEIENLTKLREDLPQKYKNFIPKIKWHKTDGDNPYIIYEYAKADTLGSFVEDMGIRWGLFKHNNFNCFVRFFAELSELRHDRYSDTCDNWGQRTANREIQHYFENVNNLLPSPLYDKVLSHIERHSQKAFKYKVLSHRDFYP